MYNYEESYQKIKECAVLDDQINIKNSSNSVRLLNVLNNSNPIFKTHFINLYNSELWFCQYKSGKIKKNIGVDELNITKYSR